MMRLDVYCLLPVCLCLLGCGGSDDFPTAPVSGIVTCEGKPLTGGRIIFSPMGDPDSALTGKKGIGEIQPDGSYTISTYGNNDGAVVGNHQISFNFTGSEEQPIEKPSCKIPSDLIKEVTKGTNEIEIAL